MGTCRSLTLAAIVAFTAASSTSAVTYYVSADADSATADGTLARPYRTIQKAASRMAAGDSCLIRTGIYRETIVPAASGVAGRPVVFMAYPGDNVFVSAADPVTGWTVDKGSIYKAPLSWDLGKGRNQLFVNGEMMIEARLPNIDASPTNGDRNNVIFNTRRAADLTYYGKTIMNPAWIACGSQSKVAGSMKVWVGAAQDGDGKIQMVPFLDSCRRANAPQNFLAGALVQRSCAGYSADHGTVVSGWGMETGTTLNGWMYLTVDPTTANFAHWWFGGGGVIFSGLRCFLDAQKEWALDNGTIYFRAPGDADPNTLLVEAKRRQLVMNLANRNYITVQGLNFLGGSINMNGCNNCLIDDCHLRYITHYTLAAHYTNDKLTGESAIYIKGDNNKFINSSVEYSAASGVFVLGDANLVDNCLITNCSYLGNYEVGAALGAEVEGTNTLSHCTMYNFGRSALTFAASPDDQDQIRGHLPAGQIFRYNDLYNSMFMADDGGTFYMLGVSCGGTEFGYNWLHDMVRSYNAHHIYCDLAGGFHYMIHHNVFWQQHGESPNNSITTAPMRHITYNNTSVSVGQYVPSAEYQPWDDDERGVNALWVDGDPVGWGLKDWENHDFSLVAGSKAIDKGTFDADSQYIHLWNFTGYRGECYLLDTPFVVADSMVVGPKPDLGAYEFGKPRWVPGCSDAVKNYSWEYPPSVSVVGNVATRLGSPVHVRCVLSARGLSVSAPGVRGFTVRVMDAAGRTVTWRRVRDADATVIPAREMPHAVLLARVVAGDVLRTYRLTVVK